MKKNNFHNLSGEQKEQVLIVTDKKGKPLGKATREECHKGKGITHLAFMAFVLDREGKIILTRRSRKKSLWEGFWDASVVSHVLPGETVERAAERRGKEELGIEVEFKRIGSFYYFAKFGENCENEYCHVLIGKSNLEVDFNPVEIEEIRKISLAELKEEIKDHEKTFTPWFLLALEKIDLSNIHYLVPEV